VGFNYKPLFKLLVDRNMKKTDLHSEVGLSSATLAKLGKKETISGESIEKLCLYFRCQPGEIVEYEFTKLQEPNAAASSNPRNKTKDKKAIASQAARLKRTKH